MSTVFNVPTREQVKGVNQEIFDKLQKALGFVPNLYATIAYSDNGLDRYLAFQNAKTSLSNKEKEAGQLRCQSRLARRVLERRKAIIRKR